MLALPPYQVAIIEDEPFYRILLRDEISSLAWQGEDFDHPEGLFQALVAGKKYDLIISDRFFFRFDSVKDNLPTILRDEFGYQGVIVLLSNSLEKSSNTFDFAYLKGQPLDFKLIEAKIKQDQ